MTSSRKTQGIHLKLFSRPLPSGLALDVQSFLLDARASNLAPGTLKFYRLKLEAFSDYLLELGIASSPSIQPLHIRRFLVHLTESNHTQGGVHAYWRATKAFLRWFVQEGTLEHDPSEKVRPTRQEQELLEPVNLEHLQAMVTTCDKSERGLRDRAVLLLLLDSGLRAGEMLALNVGDVDIQTGSVTVRKSKSRKPRVSFIGSKSRRAMIAYLRRSGDAIDEPLWLAFHNIGVRTRLSYDGLRAMLKRRARQGEVPTPTLHSFRRAFALAMLRNGADVVSLSRMMGHGSLGVLMRYLRQEVGDLGRVHEQHSPVDNIL